MTKINSGDYCSARKHVTVSPVEEDTFGRFVVAYNDYAGIAAQTYYGGLFSRNLAAKREIGKEVLTGKTGDSLIDRAKAYHPFTHLKAALSGDQVINSAASVKGLAEAMRTLGIECVNEAGEPVTPVLTVDDVMRIGAASPARR